MALQSSSTQTQNLSKTSSLWAAWWEAVWLLHPAFSQMRTFLWFVLIVAGMTIHQDDLGATRIVRGLRLKAASYHSLLRTFHSNAINLDKLACLWMQVALRIFQKPVVVNGRKVLVGDGIKIAKRGKKMPAVKLLHQESENKAEFIMGHSIQAVTMLVHAEQSVAAVPLVARIHEGVVFSNRSSKTLLDKMLDLLRLIELDESFYFIADAYYAAKKMGLGLLNEGHHLVTRVRCNAVAHAPAIPKAIKSKGRPATYGKPIYLEQLTQDDAEFFSTKVSLYGEQDAEIRYSVVDALWKPLGRKVRFVIVEHSTRGKCILMSTDTDLNPTDIIHLYALRYKIEYTFKQAVHQVGTFAYRFWMKSMKPTKFGKGNQYVHREDDEYRRTIREKLHAYHVHIQAGLIAQGLSQYLSASFSGLVWSSFGSWLRTIRPGIAPSEFVVAEALRQSMPDFLLSSAEHHPLAKFILEKQGRDTVPFFAMAA